MIACTLWGGPPHEMNISGATTYLETMACGVPVFGYANEAFTGLMRMCPAGESVAIDDWAAMAAAIARLSRDPEHLGKLASQALSFAREHTFEQEFLRRIEHMKALVPDPVSTLRQWPTTEPTDAK